MTVTYPDGGTTRGPRSGDNGFEAVQSLFDFWQGFDPEFEMPGEMTIEVKEL